MQSGTLNLKELKIPNKIGNPLITFSKKNSNTYTFFHIAQEKNVENKFIEWLNNDLTKIKQYSILNEYDPTNVKDLSYLKIDDNPVWVKIKNSIFDQTKQTLAKSHKDLEKVNHGYFIYQKFQDGYLVRVNRLKPSFIMNGNGIFLASTFKNIVEEKGVRLEHEPQLLIICDNYLNNAISLIFDGAIFELIFDYFEYKTDFARNIVDNTFSKISDLDVIKSVILEDKNLINMLNKPLVKSGNINTSIEYLKKAKSESKKELSYEIKGNKIIFPDSPKERKKAVHDMLKAATYHITATLDNKHIIEGNPLRIIK